MLSKLFSKKDGDDKDDKGAQSAPPAEPPARPPSTATPPAETAPNVQGGILKPPQKTEGNIAVGRQKRITQRITIAITPPAPGARAGLKISLPSAKPAPASMPAMPPVSGNVELPLSIIIPSLPASALKEPADKLLEGEMAAKTASLPLASILGMLPLGRIEFQLKELATYLPVSGIFKATEEFGDEICSLPLPEVVKRVPPELLARRSDQKPIDEKIQKMADPFASEVTIKEPEPAAAPESPMPLTPDPFAAAPTPASTPEPTPTPEPIAAEIPTPEPTPTPAAEPPLDLAALTQEATGATEPIGVPVIPPLPTTEDFTLPPELAAMPTPKAPEPEPAAPIMPPLPENPKEDFAQTDALKSLMEEAKLKTAKTPEVPKFDIPAPTPDTSEMLKEAETPAPAPAPAFSFTPEKVAEPEPTPTPAPAPEPSSFAVEQNVPAGLESFSKVVDKLSPKEETPAELPKEEPKFEFPTPSTTSTPTPEPEPMPEPIAEIAPKEELPPASKPMVSSLSAKVNLNQCTSDDLVRQAGCPENLARKIIAWRELHGTFTDLHFLWNIPGMTTEVYRLLTGLPDEESAVELNDIFGLVSDAHLTVKEVATRIRSWPFMSGCIISGMEGLPIAFDCDDKKFAKAICAFAPKLLQQAHDILEEINEPEAHEVHLMQEDKTISIFRYEHLILITINRRKGLSSRDVELLRQVVVKLSNVKGAKLEV